MTKKELNEYRWLKKNIEQLECDLLFLESQATKVSPVMSDMPSGSGTVDKIGNIVADIIATKDLINERLVRMYSLRKEIEISISELPAREQCLIRLRYIEGKSWEQIAVDMHYGWAQIHRIHSDSLVELRQ